MLTITIPKRELWDEKTEQFIYSQEVTMELEHSLAALSKWESIYEKPFFGREEKTTEEITGYIKAMCVTPGVPDEMFKLITADNSEELSQINEYIGRKMTATWFKEAPGGTSKRSNEMITAELVYYWMVSFNIPFECEHWHLNKLMTLIRVCNLKSQPQKKMSRRDAAAQQRALNAQRKAAYGTTG